MGRQHGNRGIHQSLTSAISHTVTTPHTALLSGGNASADSLSAYREVRTTSGRAPRLHGLGLELSDEALSLAREGKENRMAGLGASQDVGGFYKLEAAVNLQQLDM
jgi:hypothetical protein